MKTSELLEMLQIVLQRFGDMEVRIMKPGSFSINESGRPRSENVDIIFAALVETEKDIALVLGTEVVSIPNGIQFPINRIKSAEA
jgi:hypothetical protein